MSKKEDTTEKIGSFSKNQVEILQIKKFNIEKFSGSDKQPFRLKLKRICDLEKRSEEIN